MNVRAKNAFENLAGSIVVFLYFSYVAFYFTQMQSHARWVRNLVIAFGIGLIIALFFILMRSLFMKERTRIWISRVLRAISVAFLVHGFVILPFLMLSFAGRSEVSFDNLFYKFSSNLDHLFDVQAWTFIGSAFAVASFAFWKNKWSAVIALFAMILFHYCLFRPSSAWFWR